MTTNFWTDKPVFITGGTGFVGGWLTRKLIDLGANVVMLVRDRKPEAWPLGAVQVFGDVRDQNLMERIINQYSVDCIFHLAAQTIVGKAREFPRETMDTNISGTLSILEAARTVRPQAKVIIASSDKCYGECPGDGNGGHLAYTETMALQPRHPYDVSKAAADLIAQSYMYDFGLNVAISRSANVFGPGDLAWHRLIPNTIRRILREQTPVVYGSGGETRDYLYVDDAVSGYLALAERDATGPFNFSNGHELTVAEVIQAICKVMDTPICYKTLNRLEGELSFQTLDWTRARLELGWKPAYSFERGLAETVSWYKSYLQ